MAGKIYGAVHPYVGQEAVAAGVCASLTDARSRDEQRTAATATASPRAPTSGA